MKNLMLAVSLPVVLIWALAVSAEDAEWAVAKIVDPQGEQIGSASFEQTPTGVLIHVEVSGLEPGAHGIHLHTVGSCSPDFAAAMGHINPEGKAHGFRNPDGPDPGNLPMIFVNEDGEAEAEYFNTRVSISDSALSPLLDEDGSTLVIHAQPDDHFTQPIGGSGGRVACGVIVPTD